MKKTIMRTLLITALSLSLHFCAKAQTDPGDPGQDPDLVPLDPGTWVLVAVGAGYGIKKLRDARRENRKSNLNATADLYSENKTNGNR